VSSSRVLAGGRNAVRCQLRGQYGASGPNREGGEGRITTQSGLATTDKRAIARALEKTTRPGQDRDVTNRDFPHQRNKPSKPRSTSTESLTP